MDFSQYKVLLVDDEISYRTFLRTLIEKQFKAKVIEARNPKEAFDYLKTEIPSLIILDMQMPVMDGLTALTYIRSNSTTRFIPVIACTAMSKTDLVLKLAELGIADYIVKSSPANVFAEKILKVLKQIDSEKKEKEQA